MVWNVQAPWDVYPSPTLCGLCLKVLRGRNGDADKKPIPTLTKDENRPSGRTTGLRAEQAEPAGIRKGDTLKVFVLNMRGKPLMPCRAFAGEHGISGLPRMFKTKTFKVSPLRIPAGSACSARRPVVRPEGRFSSFVNVGMGFCLHHRSYLSELLNTDRRAWD